MGVESYLLKENVMLYEAGSPKDFAEDVPLPDHAVGIVADAGDRSFYIQETYAQKPTEAEIRGSYLELGAALAKELRGKRIYTKEVFLTTSNPEVPLPKELVEEFGKERKAFKACSLMWLWLVSPQRVQT